MKRYEDPGGGLTSRRALLRYAGLAAITTASVAACGSTAPSSSKGGGATGAVVYDGKPFNAHGAVLNVGNWGGFWQDFQTKYAIDPFEKTFNAKVNYDSNSPYYPAMAVAGIQNPPLDVYSFDQDTEFDNKPFLVSPEEVKANCPNARSLWPFAFQTTGTTWCWSEMVHAYRTDLVKPKPQGFKSIFEGRFDGKRGMYTIDNAIGIRLVIVANKAYGSGYTDWATGMKIVKQAAPWNVQAFTGTMQGLLENGEVVIAPIDRAEFYSMKVKGVPVDYVSWSDVTRPLVPEQFGVSAHSKNLKLAYAFLNWILGTQVQSAWASKQYWLPANKTVRLSPALTSAGFANSAAMAGQLNALDGAWLSWFKQRSTLTNELTAALA